MAVMRVGRYVKQDKKRQYRDTEGSTMIQKLGNKQNDVIYDKVKLES